MTDICLKYKTATTSLSSTTIRLVRHASLSTRRRRMAAMEVIKPTRPTTATLVRTLLTPRTSKTAPAAAICPLQCTHRWITITAQAATITISHTRSTRGGWAHLPLAASCTPTAMSQALLRISPCFRTNRASSCSTYTRPSIARSTSMVTR